MTIVMHEGGPYSTGKGGLLITEGEGHVNIKSQRGSTGLHVHGAYSRHLDGFIPVNQKSTALLLLVAVESQPNDQFRYKFLGFTPAILFQKAPDTFISRTDVRGYIPLIKLKGRWASAGHMLKRYGWNSGRSANRMHPVSL